MIKRILLLLALMGGSFGLVAQEEELLLPEEAFPVTVTALDSKTVRTTWNIADGYYLYRNKFKFESLTSGITLGPADYPKGKIKDDEFFGKMEIYRGTIHIDIPITRNVDAGNELTLKISSQGCADIGVCYPPHRQEKTLSLPPMSAGTSSTGSLDAIGNDNFLEEGEVLDPDVAFVFSAEAADGNTLIARWQIAPEHYLYRDKFTFRLLDANGVTLGEPQIPMGEEKNDEFFGQIRIFHDEVTIYLPLQRSVDDAMTLTLEAGYQGCAEAGICYPPMKKSTEIAVPDASVKATANIPVMSAAPPATTGPSQASGYVSEQDQLAAALADGNTIVTLLLFLGAGLLLAFTPCVFPMIPILSSIIVGQGESITTRKAFVLSLTYVLAMAATYTIAGVIAGLFGANIQAAFQNPWVLGSFAAVFVALSLSMFGFYELQLPSALQSKLTEVSNRQEGGSLTGVAIMGLLSALIVGPCVAPPLMGALIYIGQTGDPWLGGAALFALSMGMGAPLIAIGTAGGKFLPRAGGWMDAVKAVFGVLLLGVAIWMLERILPGWLTVLLWALLAIVSAIYMGAIDSLGEGASGWRKLWKGLGFVLLVWGVLMLIGAGSGGRDPLMPLSHLRGSAMMGGIASTSVQPAHLQFQRIKSIADLEREVAASAASGQSVMLDFYADWCVSCKEFEKYTFTDPRVINSLNGVKLLQADVTANDDVDKALMKHFNLIGPPAILFWGPNGQEKPNYRVVGFMDAEEFNTHLNRALP